MISALALLVNVVWHILNFSGWLNQNLWYRIAGNLDEALGQWKLPTDDFKEKIKLPYGWIYWLAQLVPTGFSIGAAICLAKGLSRFGLCKAALISSAVWIFVAIAAVLIEYKAIPKRKDIEVL
jgi:drug/metabolite transporter (DMT)-like permease